VTLRLTADRQRWHDHIDAVVASYAPVRVVPVVKGNGYGFGRSTLFPVAADVSDMVCVGTVHELDGVPPTSTPVVLTPHSGPCHGNLVHTVGNARDVNGLEAGARVMVKLRSSMRRYGAGRAELPALLDAIERCGLDVVAYSIHLPLVGDDEDRMAEVVDWLPATQSGVPLWVSHLGPDAARRLADVAGREIRIRLGTALWHGDKSFLHLGADVIDTCPVAAGERVGYRSTPVPADGTLVMIGCGSAQGVSSLADDRSPFHFRRQRLALVEAPHMHTSMAWVGAGDAVPQPGDIVDVQRPLITTLVDEVRWT
jgi:alanine racemase